MTILIRWVVVAVLLGHGLLHLLGVAKGFGWAEIPQLKNPIGPGNGVVWLLAAVLVLGSAALIATQGPRVVVGRRRTRRRGLAGRDRTSWSDAKYGTAVNLILILAALYGYASLGPSSFHEQFHDQARAAMTDARAVPRSLVTEQDLADLPEPLAAYLRRSGAVGKPRVMSLSVQFHGRIRSGPGQEWMPFTGEQLNTYGPRPQRVFIMDATRSGLPVTVLHSYKDTTATMRAKVLSLFTVVNATGPEMDRGETVTVFNDLVVLAPGAITEAPVRWTAVDAHHVRGRYTNGDQTVSAVLTFDADHDLVDFVSEDRLRASADGKTFNLQTWSTPWV